MDVVDNRTKVHLYVETSPLNFQRAVTFKTDVEVDGNDVNIHMSFEKSLLALAMLADVIDAEVYHDGEKVELEL